MSSDDIKKGEPTEEVLIVKKKHSLKNFSIFLKHLVYWVSNSLRYWSGCFWTSDILRR
ncbi:hypothetical protein [Candidatus Nitrosocosmicus sp. R]